MGDYCSKKSHINSKAYKSTEHSPNDFFIAFPKQEATPDKQSTSKNQELASHADFHWENQPS